MMQALQTSYVRRFATKTHVESFVCRNQVPMNGVQRAQNFKNRRSSKQSEYTTQQLTSKSKRTMQNTCSHKKNRTVWLRYFLAVTYKQKRFCELIFKMRKTMKQNCCKADAKREIATRQLGLYALQKQLIFKRYAMTTRATYVGVAHFNTIALYAHTYVTYLVV